MKSEHRHELKTNELAEWLANLPQWTKENMTTILVVLAVIVVGVAFFLWRTYSKNVVQVREHLEFTNLLNQLSGIESQIPAAQANGSDLSANLIPAADALGSFAQNTRNNRMAALALIKQAEALRSEMHYRPGIMSTEDITNRVNQAKTAYTGAIQRASNAALKAAAQFGLGLCEEELGNFDQAKEIYQGITENDDYDGTVAKASAKYRLETMADYRQKVVYKPAPAPAAASQPSIQINPDTNMLTASQPTIQLKPVDVTIPPDANQKSQESVIVPEVNPKVPEPNVSGE